MTEQCWEIRKQTRCSANVAHVSVVKTYLYYKNRIFVNFTFSTLHSQKMAAATSSCSTAISSSSKTLTKTTSTTFPPTNLSFSKLHPQPVRARRCIAVGSALGARMVSAPPAARPALLDFDTSIFKKERVNLAGQDEVRVN